ncbi:hypothetical protein FF098_006145 [Parvularcula flava]|uniref:Uncharacterized protein n=1 Tax=Aquisalinus luteolus TaxID=1566827 RepID=A0A8J3A375_9PROT|nr:hypothetical protein [Aquisalinus luteolus]NHK27480.1 hypothetical protein [Aquisalinus luteolus]GGH95565.1 hypothetical protein GCM10011355_12410 [Aquisalinus luteolus]
MTKLSLTSVLNESFQFGVSRFWTIIRCVLLPYIILVVGITIIALSLIDFQAIIEMADGGMSEPDNIDGFLDLVFRTNFWMSVFILYLASLVLMLPLMGGMTSLYRLVGLGEEPGGWFNLRFDGPMWRLVIASLIFSVIQYIIWGIGFGVAYALNPQAMEGIGEMIAVFQNMDFDTGNVGYDPDPSAIGALFGFFFLGWLITLILSIAILTRLAPFMAATACENRLMLLSSWSMTKGNFWVILGAYVMMVLGFVALQLIYGMLTLVIQMIVTVVSFGLLTAVYNIVDFAVNMAIAAFMLGVQVAFASSIYRKLWLEGGDSETGSGGLEA